MVCVAVIASHIRVLPAFVIAADAATGLWEEEGRRPPEENPVVQVSRDGKACRRKSCFDSSGDLKFIFRVFLIYIFLSESQMKRITRITRIHTIPKGLSCRSAFKPASRQGWAVYSAFFAVLVNFCRDAALFLIKRLNIQHPARNIQ